MTSKIDLINLNIEKLFEENHIEQIIEIEKSLTGEIEKKRNDLRSMVSDRYKDILTASDYIKSMENISDSIVKNIENITQTTEYLVDSSLDNDKIESEFDLENKTIEDEERILILQIRLCMFLNEQIWIILENDDNLEATQIYILTQYIYMSINLTKKEYIGSLPYLDHIKLCLDTLRTEISEKAVKKLQSVDIQPEEACQNLNVLILLQNQTSDKLLNMFIDYRKIALNTIINTQYSNVRNQIAAMVKCLMTTMQLLHDCFMNTENKPALIWNELNKIIGDNSPPTISKLNLPVTPLMKYIPNVIKEFRPKIKISKENEVKFNDKNRIDDWLISTQKTIENGLEKALLLLTTIKSLYLVREESLKIACPINWDKICNDLELPDNFSIWHYFFQNLVTLRAETLITKIIKNSIDNIKTDIKSTLNSEPNIWKTEKNLKQYVWYEDSNDIGKLDIKHENTMLHMKTKGFSKQIIKLCEKLDKKFQNLLEDTSQYLFGIEFNENLNTTELLDDYKFKRKFTDREKLTNHLRIECVNNSVQIPKYIEDLLSNDRNTNFIIKSLFCARFLQASCSLCNNFKKCCKFNHVDTEWQNVCDTFTKISQKLWLHWVDSSTDKFTMELKLLSDISARNIINNVSKWDEIEIEEEANEKTYNSQIKVPLKPSIHLTTILFKLNQELSKVLPYTLPKIIHINFIEKHINLILNKYKEISLMQLNQQEALQFLFDVRFFVTLCIPKENISLATLGQNICDNLRNQIDPFDLDVFYGYLQNNVRKAIAQSEIEFGCLLPSSDQLINLGSYTKNKEQDKDPSLIALSTPSINAWFPLLPITAPSQKLPGSITKNTSKHPTSKSTPKKSLSQDVSSSTTPTTSTSTTAASAMRQSAVSLFGNLTNDWFS